MKIRLIRDLPIEAKHGCVKGREYEVTAERRGRNKLYYFIGDVGEECAAFRFEIEIIDPKLVKEDEQ